MSQIDEAKEFLQKQSSLINEVYKEISKSRGSYQTARDLNSGIFRQPSGIITPFKLYRFVADHYDLILFQAFVKLYGKILESEEKTFVGFSFRVIQELGITKFDIFFSNGLDEKEKKYIKLILTMLDFILIGGEYSKHFVNLFDEEKDKLNKNGKDIFGAVYEHYSRGNLDLPNELLEKTNKFRTDTINGYRSRIKAEPFIDKDKMKKLLSFWSELLHGNPLMIEQVVNDKFQWSSRLRAILLITGRNVLLRTRPMIKSSSLLEKIDNAILESETIWKAMIKNWQQSAPTK